MKCRIIALALSLGIALATPARAQFGNLGKVINKAAEVRQDLTFSDEEEQQLGSDISTRIRDKYGVVQDRAVHRYLTLVGSVLASASSRPNLKWTFVVLDTDGVNAFAAPGGFIHITRGALAIIQNEAELADVLAHEIVHVTERHTVKAIQNANRLRNTRIRAKAVYAIPVAAPAKPRLDVVRVPARRVPPLRRKLASSQR